MNDIPPLWYTEGIAEYFSTHQVVEVDLPAQFGVMPSDVKLFPGWGRISEIRRSFVGRPSAEVVPGDSSALMRCSIRSPQCSIRIPSMRTPGPWFGISSIIHDGWEYEIS